MNQEFADDNKGMVLAPDIRQSDHATSSSTISSRSGIPAFRTPGGSTSQKRDTVGIRITTKRRSSKLEPWCSRTCSVLFRSYTTEKMTTS
ncbi:unnamed protein product [Bursaphelenchus okinawaensis]|uniref:Uncharacterized protein n=1 Tax=Bursaphelenchus okinawaensis TaxID=465554 RepID=A0A811L5P5_9BILA|nr:unnamed protein product [Bursaphelenchus okinawaensis]CAG9119934.1 unnamed protein product [Bursaphelenchus okinawaensis]